MNFYSFHLGDYASHTAHLEPMEDLAYRRMLDLYYLREGPLPVDPNEVARLIRFRNQEDAVVAVLHEFFQLVDDGWAHDRCDEELARMRDKQAKARASGLASVNARRTNAQRTLNDRPTDVELPIPIPIPIPSVSDETLQPRKRGKPVERPDDISEQTWNDYLAIRKAKRAPLTATALAQLRNEAAKAEVTLQSALETCCARGWQGFKADWLLRDRLSTTATTGVASRPAESFRERDERLARERYEEATGKRRNLQANVIDITPNDEILELTHEPSDPLGRAPF